jgi:hypothetical protein
MSEGVLVPGAALSPVIPPKNPNEASTQVTITTTKGLAAELDLISLMETEARGEEMSRSEVASYVWEAGLKQHWLELGVPRPSDPLQELEKYRSKKKK